MVEVMMDEGCSENTKNTPVQSTREPVSPYFSGGVPPSNVTPGKRKEKVIVNQIPKIESNSIAQLQADWDSPEPTPEKAKHPSASKPRQPTPCSSGKSTPQTVAGQVVKKMLEEDWGLCSPHTTPLKDIKGVKGQSNGKHTPNNNGYPERTSDEEFQEEVIVFRTPKKPKPKNSPKKSGKKSSEKASKESVADGNKSTLTTDRINNALRSPASSQGSTALESEGDSIPLFSPIRSPGLVSPVRSPTPSPDCKTLNPVIRKLFTPPVSPHDSPDSSPEVSPKDTMLYIKELTYANFLLNETEMTGLEEVLAILSSEELHGLCKEMKIRSSGKKEELVSNLIKFTKQQKSIFSAFKKTANEDSVVLKR
ncbi:hypothetical protein C7M84_001902 [Penaeus vannamei]|uniref:SAP domain-containing protein n=1 Tax=Penaeus vannamei TaxID=6689 RepID=A0A423TSG8_PENVA|nr:hypothetical protein C7M84_001902 [Penaeus vannamei]